MRGHRRRGGARACDRRARASARDPSAACRARAAPRGGRRRACSQNSPTPPAFPAAAHLVGKPARPDSPPVGPPPSPPSPTRLPAAHGAAAFQAGHDPLVARYGDGGLGPGGRVGGSGALGNGGGGFADEDSAHIRHLIAKYSQPLQEQSLWSPRRAWSSGSFGSLADEAETDFGGSRVGPATDRAAIMAAGAVYSSLDEMHKGRALVGGGGGCSRWSSLRRLKRHKRSENPTESAEQDGLATAGSSEMDCMFTIAKQCGQLSSLDERHLHWPASGGLATESSLGYLDPPPADDDILDVDSFFLDTAEDMTNVVIADPAQAAFHGFELRVAERRQPSMVKPALGAAEWENAEEPVTSKQGSNCGLPTKAPSEGRAAGHPSPAFQGIAVIEEVKSLCQSLSSGLVQSLADRAADPWRTAACREEPNLASPPRGLSYQWTFEDLLSFGKTDEILVACPQTDEQRVDKRAPNRQTRSCCRAQLWCSLYAHYSSASPFLPLAEVRARVCLADLLLRYSANVAEAKAHMERTQVLLKQVAGNADLKCRALSLLSRCYHLVGTTGLQKLALRRALELLDGHPPDLDRQAALLWRCNFLLQMASTLLVEGDLHGAQQALATGRRLADELPTPVLALLFAACMLHVHLTASNTSATAVAEAIEDCAGLWARLTPEQQEQHRGLQSYALLLQAMWALRVCDHDSATRIVAELEKTVPVTKDGCQAEEPIAPNEGPRSRPALSPNEDVAAAWTLGPPPLDCTWLPLPAVQVLTHLVGLGCSRPSGKLSEALMRLKSGLEIVDAELQKLGIHGTTTETDMQLHTVWSAGPYLLLWLHLQENSTILALTQSNLVDAQQTLSRMLDIIRRFPVMLQGFENQLRILLGLYAQSSGCYRQAAAHFQAAQKANPSDSSKAMCNLLCALSHLSRSTPDSISQAVDLLSVVQKRVEQSGEADLREKGTYMYASGLLFFKQGKYAESRLSSPASAYLPLKLQCLPHSALSKRILRSQCASSLKLAHKKLQNHDLVMHLLHILSVHLKRMSEMKQSKELAESALVVAGALHHLPLQLECLQTLQGATALRILDYKHAQQILTSAVTLSKTVGDMACQLASLQDLGDVYAALGHSRQAQETVQIVERKGSELVARLEAASNSPLHTLLLQNENNGNYNGSILGPQKGRSPPNVASHRRKAVTKLSALLCKLELLHNATTVDTWLGHGQACSETAEQKQVLTISGSCCFEAKSSCFASFFEVNRTPVFPRMLFCKKQGRRATSQVWRLRS
eukprot:SM000425S15894  [mRNA]  locus=s425:2995:14228:+ [translate_table: standard]